MYLHQGIIIFACISFTCAQILNGYINPLWMSDRRARARSFYTNQQQQALPVNTDYYATRGGTYSDGPALRRMAEYYYLDDMGRYRPIYREDRIYRTNPRGYYNTAEQQHQEYIAYPPNSETVKVEEPLDDQKL